MDESVSPQAQPPLPPSPTTPIPALCPQCYLPVPPGAHFCPNCGKKLSDPQLSTSITSQILLYGFSIVLPIICYLAISYWQGIKYIRSHDPKAQEIGWIALMLLIISSIITFWLAGIWISQFLQSATGGLGTGGSAGLSSYGL